MYRESTRGIQVDVQCEFVPERSDPARPYYFFAYTIRISNMGDRPARLVSRYWKITDGTGEVREVAGEGVVGQQPSLAAGESFEYTSFCPLPTPTGNMRGTYLMQLEDGESFEARIPLFFLRAVGGIA